MKINKSIYENKVVKSIILLFSNNKIITGEELHKCIHGNDKKIGDYKIFSNIYDFRIIGDFMFVQIRENYGSEQLLSMLAVVLKIRHFVVLGGFYTPHNEIKMIRGAYYLPGWGHCGIPKRVSVLHFYPHGFDSNYGKEVDDVIKNILKCNNILDVYTFKNKQYLEGINNLDWYYDD